MRIKSHCCHAGIEVEDTEWWWSLGRFDAGYKTCSQCANSKTHHECLAEELPDCEACPGDTVWHKGEHFQVESCCHHRIGGGGWCAMLVQPGNPQVTMVYTRDLVVVKRGDE